MKTISGGTAIQTLNLHLTSDEFRRMKLLIETRTGIHFPETKRLDLIRAILAINKKYAFKSVLVLYNQLDTLSLDDELWRDFIDIIAIRETYFFRNKVHFETLTELVFPSLVEKKNKKLISIWSAGCSTGEEPYSLAIAMKNFVKKHPLVKFQIFGTDINNHSLNRAREGIYGDWSFRNTEPTFRQKYFTPAGKRFSLMDSLKKTVSFHYLNLADSTFPYPFDDSKYFDLILCRNVTIYFQREIRTALVERFKAALSPGGWMLFGESEPPVFNCTNLREHTYKGTLLYEKTSPEGRFFRTPAIQTDKRIDYHFEKSQSEDKQFHFTESKNNVGRKSRKPQPASPENVCLSQISGGVTGGIEAAFLNICDGAFDEARVRVEDLQSRTPLEPAVYFVDAVIHLEKNNITEAEKLLKKTLYLDNDFIMAHYLLLSICASKGALQLLEPGMRHLQKILVKQEPEEIIPYSQGMTVQEMFTLLDDFKE